VLRDGSLQQCGSPRELYDRPANSFVAGFIGSPAMNLCEVVLSNNGSVSFGDQPVEVPANLDGRPAVLVGLRPEALELGADGIPARVEVVEEFGADAYVFCAARLGDETTRLVARTEAKTAPERGDRIALRVRSGEAHLFDAETGERLGSD